MAIMVAVMMQIGNASVIIMIAASDDTVGGLSNRVKLNTPIQLISFRGNPFKSRVKTDWVTN